MCSGYHLILLPASISSSFLSSTFMYHCLVFKNSSSVEHRSCTLTAWVIGFCAINNPAVFRSLRISFLASFRGNPWYLPASSFILPSFVITIFNGRLYFLHHSTSVLSPKVQTIT